MRSISVDARPEIAAAITAAVEATLADEAATRLPTTPPAVSAWRQAGIIEATSPMSTTGAGHRC